MRIVWALYRWAFLAIESAYFLVYLLQYTKFIFLTVETSATISLTILEIMLGALIAPVIARIAI